MTSIVLAKATVPSPAAKVTVYRDSVTGGIRVELEDESRPPKWNGAVNIDSGSLSPSSSLPFTREKVSRAFHLAMSSDALPERVQSVIRSRHGYARVQEALQPYLEEVSA